MVGKFLCPSAIPVKFIIGDRAIHVIDRVFAKDDTHKVAAGVGFTPPFVRSNNAVSELLVQMLILHANSSA